MQNFNKSWKNFLSEGTIPEKASSEDTRYRIKLETKEKILREVTEDEMEHIQKAIDEFGPDELAFNDLFEGKNRLIINFPTADETTVLGTFINMWKSMGYEVDWERGMVTGERVLRDTSPEAMAAEIANLRGGRPPGTKRKINMKIGKWLSKLYEYMIKMQKLDLQVKEYVLGRGETRGWIDHDNPRITGADIEGALGEDDAKNYYRLADYIDMMTRIAQSRSAHMGSYAGLNQPTKVKEYMRYWQENAGYIKKNINDVTSDRFSIIITRDPIDVWRMADFDNIESCHSPPSRGGGSEYYKCAVAEAHGHGAVAYVIYTEELLMATETDNVESAEQEIQDGEIFGDDARVGGGGFDIMPISRLRLRQVRYYTHNEEAALLAKYGTIGDLPDDLPEDEMRALVARIRRAGSSEFNPFEGVQLAVPERRIYGSSIPGFYNRIIEWARERQGPQMERAPRTGEEAKLNLDDFIKFGGSHDDNSMRTLLTDLYGYTIDQTHGHVKQDSDTEDNLDANLVAGLLERYQLQLSSISEEFNHNYAAATVEGTALDDGGGGVYITCEATLKITWDKDDWNSMPGVDLIEHALSELKDYGLGWVKSDYPYVIQKLQSGEIWMLPIDVAPEGLAGFGAQEYAYDPVNFGEFCSAIDGEVDDKREMVKAILTNFFKREGYMEGGLIMGLGRQVVNDDTGLLHWEADAEEGYEIDEYEFIQFTAHPEVWYDDFNATEEQAMRIMNDRDFWLEIRKRMAAPAFENTGGQMYPQMPLDMDMFGHDGTEGKSQELNLYFSVHDDAPDEQVEVLKELVEIWDDQDEIDRVVSEVFRDMLAGSVGMDGTPVGDLPGDWSVSESNKREELNALRIERMLAKL